MQLRTQALDCLYLNWALPRASVPELPAPLSYEVHEWQGAEYVFASVLLFRLADLRLDGLPFPRLSHPQMSCRVYVLDGEGVPSVLFRRVLVPIWAVPLSRLLGRQPASAASFSYPRPSKSSHSDGWSWSVGGRRRLEVSGRLAAPSIGPGPRLGSWQQALDYFRQRPRGYVVWDRRLRPINTSRIVAEAWPLQVEVGAADLLRDCFADVEPEVWSAPHSAWLCPEIPLRLELAELRSRSLTSTRLPAPEGC